MVQAKEYFVLGDQTVAKFKVVVGDGSGLVEAVLQKGEVVDHTIVFDGPTELREQIEHEAKLEMNKLAETV
ncbi:hypothetical protein LC087_19395 (plasmid) [Bacillus carboniphilus]|uniref:Uncharacterized protein n=1 Tax=Bacillus carboniphilus TaxID=86663 RepID=A0ABY9K0A2_9BACI|nr:hypothetical protein [Bacillus carboniphilus]WLR44468.1 hypothetical protein LC087_19395 [Bacillus carboniphilus]